jgi:mannobiose 2-epimerase
MHPSLPEPLRAEIETELYRLMGTWFPRCVDRDQGGFLCDFDHRWRPAGPQLKMLEYQARQTLTAARCATRAPDQSPLREAARHGFRYLKDRMWDESLGGWYRLLDRTGAPLEGAAKHGHGTGYAISACVACYELTGDPECLELAKRGFAWLEDHAHDSRHGGYFVFYRQDGTPILSGTQGPASGEDRDPIGTPIGFKDANTTSDLLKCFADLYRVWPDALVRTRLAEMLGILRDRLVVAPGVMHLYAHPDWTPLPDFVRYGQVLRSAHHLLFAADALGGSAGPTTERVARSMVDTLLRIAWDSRRGGFHLAGSSLGPAHIEDIVVFVPYKCWWLQADGLKVLLAMARRHPADAARYLEHFARLWDYIKACVIDARHGGWRSAGLDTTPEARRRPKATMWKDASHEVDALLDALAMQGAS